MIIKKGNTIAVVFDDHRLFTDSFSVLIERLEIFRSVHAINEERDLIQFLIKHHHTPICLFLDYYLKDKTALSLINESRRLNRQTTVIVISSVINSTAVANILAYNPQGLISKSSGFDTVLQCLAAIDRGEQYTCPVISEIVRNMNQAVDLPFTPRELEILQYFAQGLSILQTAEKTYLSKHTIVSHRRKMMTKAKVNSVVELLAYARAKELI